VTKILICLFIHRSDLKSNFWILMTQSIEQTATLMENKEQKKNESQMHLIEKWQESRECVGFGTWVNAGSASSFWRFKGGDSCGSKRFEGLVAVVIVVLNKGNLIRIWNHKILQKDGMQKKNYIKSKFFSFFCRDRKVSCTFVDHFENQCVF
jgi:hypothetical protein